METSKGKKTEIEMAGEDLFNFAIERRAVVDISGRLPGPSSAQRAKVEHELQILKIISVGWSISYYLADKPLKKELTKHFWQSVHDFSRDLSRTTELLVREDIDYFNTVRERFDMYLKKMQGDVDAPEPAVVIGPEFARVCGNAEDTHMVMAGARMFIGTVSDVKAYLEETRLR